MTHKGDILKSRNYDMTTESTDWNNNWNNDWNNDMGNDMNVVGGSLYSSNNSQVQRVNHGNMQNMNNGYQMTNYQSNDMTHTSPRAISIYSEEAMMPETMTNTAYIPAYLRHQIGRWMRIEFLIGNILEEKVGQLLDVGASYIILKMLEPSTTMLCDLYSIKFITIIYDANLERLYTR